MTNKTVSLKAFTKQEKAEWISSLSFFIQTFQKANEKQTAQSIEQVNALAAEYRMQIERLTVEMQQQQLDKERLEENIATLIESREAAQKKFEELTEEITRVSMENATLKSELEDMQNKYKAEKEMNQQLLNANKPLEELDKRKTVVELERAIDAAKMELRNAIEELEAEKKKSELYKKDLKLSQEIRESETKNVESENTVLQLKCELEDKVELLKQNALKIAESEAKKAELEKEIETEREKNASLQKELATQKEKIDFFEKKLSSEEQSVNISEQESKMLELNTKIAELETGLKIEKENLERELALSNDFKAKLANSEACLSTANETHREEKANLTNQLAELTQQNTNLQLRLEKLQTQSQIEIIEKDPSASAQQQNDSLVSFAETFSALLKNLHFGYEEYPKTEEQLLEDLDPMLSSLPELKGYRELYIFMKEKLTEINQRHEAEVFQKEGMLKAVQQCNEELEQKHESSSSEKKALIDSLSTAQLEKQEAMRKILEKVEEFSGFYESMVKSLFTTMESKSGRRSSTSLLFRLEAAALEYKQLLPFLNSYKFLDNQIKKELLDLRGLKASTGRTGDNQNNKKSDERRASELSEESDPSRTSDNDKFIEETLRGFGQYFIDLIGMKIKGTQSKERTQKLVEELEKIEPLRGLLETFPTMQRKVEELIKSKVTRDKKYEDELAMSKQNIQQITNEALKLGEKLAEYKARYNNIQETLKESLQSISTFETWMSRVEEACIMFGGIIRGFCNPANNENTLVFELKQKEKEERCLMLVKEIPELHELAQLMKLLKDVLGCQSSSPRFRNESPLNRSRREASPMERSSVASRASTATQLNRQSVGNGLGRATTETSFLRNLSLEAGFALTKRDPATGMTSSRAELQRTFSIEKLAREKRDISWKREDNSLNECSISPQKKNGRGQDLIGYQSAKPYNQESRGKAASGKPTTTRAVTPNSSQTRKISLSLVFDI